MGWLRSLFNKFMPDGSTPRGFSVVGAVSCFWLMLGAGWVPLSAAEQTFTVRVWGLFQPDRVDDLRLLVREKMTAVSVASIDYDRAEALFRFDPAVVFAGAKPEQIVERLENLVRQSSSGTFGIRAASTERPAKLERIEIPIAGLDCKACSFAAYEAVAKLDGVDRATASFRERLLVAWIDPTKTDRGKLVEALQKKRIEVPSATP